MSFSDHHRGRQSGTNTQQTPDQCDLSLFYRLDMILLKSHFAAVFIALEESDLISQLDRDKLTRQMDRPDFENHTAIIWMRNYTRFVESKNVSAFLNSVLH
jgi:hypothetical protein